MELSQPTRQWEESGRYVEAGGLRIFVYEKGAGPVIFFVHGFPTSCYDWRGIIDILSRRYRCIVEGCGWEDTIATAPFQPKTSW